MGLETATYIAGLTSAWPLAGDKKNQGDDHLRLIKSTLQATFPTASKSFYFPKVEATSGTIVLDATDQNNTVYVDTTAGNVAVTLPSTLGAADAGWSCRVAKNSFDSNAGIVSPSTGTINTKVGAVATVRIGVAIEAAEFLWTGAVWNCFKPGAVIGATYNFDGATTPAGFLDLDGSVYNNTVFAELFAVLGTTVLKDKRGRVEAGVDGGQNRLTSSYFGASAVLGAVGGLESHTLTTAQLATHTHGVTDPGHTHLVNPLNPSVMAGPGSNTFGAGSQLPTTFTIVANTTGISIQNAGSGNAHNNTQPTIIVKKIIRAC